MNTLVAIVSTGDRRRLTRYSVPRAWDWAEQQGYSFVVIKKNLCETGVLPYFAKLRIPGAFPGFDRYCILDDDLLMSREAPALPDVPDGHVGMVRDLVSENTSHPDVPVTFNSGFVVASANTADLLEAAYRLGPVETVWGGHGDQGALNLLGSQQGRIHEIDGRWNSQPVLGHIVEGPGWPLWSRSRPHRIAHYVALASRFPGEARLRVRRAWGLHLTLTRSVGLFDALLP